MAKSPKSPASFESAVGELENIVASMENDNLPLEESLARYERGIALIQFCQQALEQAEQKIQLLENGKLIEISPDTLAGLKEPRA